MSYSCWYSLVFFMFYKNVSLNTETQQVERDFDKQEAFIASAWVVVFVLCAMHVIK